MGTLFGSPTSGASRRRAAALALALPAALVVPDVATAAAYDAPVVTNTVTATYDVDHAWQVFNAVDRNQAEVPVGGTATVRYAVGATALGPPARSGYEVTGTLGVTNPGPQALPATLSAELAGAGACSVAAPDESPAAGLQVTLPSGSSSFSYTCTPGSAPTGPAATTATVSWDATSDQVVARAAGTRSGAAQSDYVVDQKTDELTTVSSATDGAASVDLGTLDWDDVWAAPDHRVLVKVSSLALGVGDGGCAEHANVARETADATTDIEVVTVCEEPEVLGEESFGKAVGRVRATCLGTVRAHLVNRTGSTVVYRLRVGARVQRFWVRPQYAKTVVSHGDPRAAVTLRAAAAQVGRTQVPRLCQTPAVLPDTGLRTTTR